MFTRTINPLKSRSFFLFGARGAGKSTLMHEIFKEVDHVYLDLLNPEVEERLSRRPSLLSEQLADRKAGDWVVIDEVQKIPRLLDVVHQLIELKKLKFGLTGSSAKKLRHGGANLLAGRASVYNLYPLTFKEIGMQFNLEDALKWGTLPGLFEIASAEERERFLRAYARTYLSEEVWNEQLIRNLDPFRKFLEIAAQENGTILNYNKIAVDVGVDHKTIQRYYQILEETLVGLFLEPYHRSVRKSQRKSPKFYLFDIGVARALSRNLTNSVVSQSYGFGRLFEQFIVLELHKANSYLERDFRFSYFKTSDGAEIDIIIERPGRPLALVEIKSTDEIHPRHTASLVRLREEFGENEAFLICREKAPRVVDGVRVLPWQEAYGELGL